MFKNLSHDVKQVDTTEGIVEAYANVYSNEDADGDISLPGSFDKAVSTGYKRIRALKDHDRYTTLGVPLSIDTKDAYGLNTTTQFNMKKDVSKDMLSDISLAREHGMNAELSIGYGAVVRDSANRKAIKEYGWLGEYSFLSSWAANDLAVVSSIKSLGDKASVIDVMRFLTKMYDLPHSDMRLKQVEDILELLEKDTEGVQQKLSEKNDTIDDILYKGLYGDLIFKNITN